MDGFVLQHIDGIPYRLKKAYDMSFIGKYGTVFKVFDDQDSGNICFGTEKDGRRYFIKFAGADTARICVTPDRAVENLRAATPTYRDLAHDNLVRLVDEEEIGGGFAAVFEWVDAECMGRMYPETRARFMALPVATRREIFEDIVRFHIHVHEKGYVAIDLYDGSIMYEVKNGRTVLCDIDFYAKKPFINPMERLWGSGRYMSPEEFEKGAVIDEVTNVYTMGATAFALLSVYDRTPEAWPLSPALYAVAAKATSDDRAMRHGSIRAFMEDWMRAAHSGRPCFVIA